MIFNFLPLNLLSALICWCWLLLVFFLDVMLLSAASFCFCPFPTLQFHWSTQPPPAHLTHAPPLPNSSLSSVKDPWLILSSPFLSSALFLPSFQVLASLPPFPSPAPRSNPVPLPQSYEPDELTEEMAHLEGLMKDLNAITTAPWACTCTKTPHTDRHTHNHTLSVTPHTHIQKVTHPKEKNTTKQYKTNQQNLRSQRLLDTKWLLIPTKKKKKLSRLPLQRKTKLPDWNVGITFSFFPRLTLLSLRKEIAMWGKKKWDNFIFIWRTILRDYELLKRKNKNKQTLVAFNRKIVNFFFFSSAKMVVIFFCLFVCFSVPNTLAWDGWFSVKSKKYAGFWCMVLMRHSLHTVFVWLVFSLCILYIYWTVSVKWTLDFSLLLLFTKPTLFINLSFVFYPRVIWLFIGFFYVIVLFFT